MASTHHSSVVMLVLLILFAVIQSGGAVSYTHLTLPTKA